VPGVWCTGLRLLQQRWNSAQPAKFSSAVNENTAVQVEFPPAARSLPEDLRDRDDDTGDGEDMEMSLNADDNGDICVAVRTRALPCVSCRAACEYPVERGEFLLAPLADRGVRGDALFGDIELAVAIDRC
jgi:hypothetical protein